MNERIKKAMERCQSEAEQDAVMDSLMDEALDENNPASGNDDQCPRDLGYDPRMYPGEPLDMVEFATKVCMGPQLSGNFLFPPGSVNLPPRKHSVNLPPPPPHVKRK